MLGVGRGEGRAAGTKCSCLPPSPLLLLLLFIPLKSSEQDWLAQLTTDREQGIDTSLTRAGQGLEMGEGFCQEGGEEETGNKSQGKEERQGEGGRSGEMMKEEAERMRSPAVGAAPPWV